MLHIFLFITFYFTYQMWFKINLENIFYMVCGAETKDLTIKKNITKVALKGVNNLRIRE